MLALEPQQRFPDRLTADGIPLGEVLLAHIIARREMARQNIRPEAFVDIIAQKHRNSFYPANYLAVVKYHVKA